METTIEQGAASQRGRLFVIQTGLITTGLTLFGVYLLAANTEDFNIMGWYANYVLPVGALIVGLAAGSGYGIGSWWAGFKMNKGLLLAVLVLQVVAYFAAQYIEFRSMHLVYKDTGEPVGFWTFFHLNAISFAWKQNKGGYGEPLGLWGYAFRGLEVAGFALGGIIAPAALMAKAYCDKCQRYKKSKELATIGASVPLVNLKKVDKETAAAHEAEQARALSEATARFDQLKQMAMEGNVEGFLAEIEPYKQRQKEVGKLPRRLRMTLVWCPGCMGGTLQAAAVIGQGEKMRVELMASAEVPAEFVQRVVKG